MLEFFLGQSSEERRFARQVLALVSAGFVAVFVVGLAAALIVVRGQEDARWVNHTFEVERHVSGIRLALEEMRSARRGALLGLRYSSGATYEEATRNLVSEVNQVQRMTRDNPRQQENVARLARKARELDRLFRETLRDRSLSVTTPRSAAEERARQQVAQDVESLAAAMLRQERQLLAEREKIQRRTTRSFYFVLAAAAVLLIAVAVLSIRTILRYTRDLNASQRDLRLLNEDLEGAVQVRTRDLSRANEEIQRFAYIVSHDLRSPLVNVMGFTAELEAAIHPLSTLIQRAEAEAPDIVSKEARLAVEEDLPESLGFIRASTQKMDRLINAILRLSREGRRPITPELISLSPLLEGIRKGLQHQIDARGAAVVFPESLPRIVSDRFALEQILSNLIENAIKYLQPGRPGHISIDAEEALGRVVIRVRDNGRGIEARDHERIFDLFRRSGPQDQPGEGIGLAHVRALAYRLGGLLRVESEFGRGSTFIVDLPVQFTKEKGELE